MTEFPDVRALLFDVFGTVVDWRGSLVAELRRLGTELGIDFAAEEIADDWRARYGPGMQRLLDGDGPYQNLDSLHESWLRDLLAERNLRLPTPAVERLVGVWHRLEPWPDAVPGLTRLRTRFLIATFSNGNVGMLVDMAEHAGLPWDVVLTPELFATYKADLDSYRRAIDLLGLEPPETMMVAAHAGELRRVAALGMRTAYVPRPMEFGTYDPGVQRLEEPVDVVADDLEQLSRLLVAGGE
jgi:2-haloacid dehalogenase